jgi:hypothetical protein
VRRTVLGIKGAVMAGTVQPGRHGHGCAAGILAEIIRIPTVEANAAALGAGIDLADHPAAVAFDRPGCRSPGRRLVLSVPCDA